jgi:hypothetical protein
VCDPELVKAMVASGLVVMAGCLTPTEILQTYRLGADVIKIFPGSLAGPSYIKAVHGPLPQIPMMPTGGVSASNVKEWFAAGAIAVGAGSELCPPALAKAGKFDEITRNAEAFVKVIAAQNAAGDIVPRRFPQGSKTRSRFYFIGVTTTRSSIMHIFPRWMAVLGCPEIVIEGVDLPIHADPQAYRQIVNQIKVDAGSLGGLVTTHKIDLVQAARIYSTRWTL